MSNQPPAAFVIVRTASRVLIGLLSLLCTQSLSAQSAQELSQVKKIYVARFTEGTGANELRSVLVKHLHKSGKFQLVETPEQADAVLKGTGQLWVTGYLSMNPRAPMSSRQAVYNGYLSVELRGQNNAVLWSYLVTPAKFSGSSVPDDLAGSLTRQLIAAQTKRSPRLSDDTGEQLEPTMLRGAGATFPAPLYLKWLESFSEKYPSIHVQYDAVGSTEGVRLLAEGKVDFAGSDVPPDAGSTASFSKFATVMGGVVCIYNVKNVSSNLKFTPEMLAGIYLGKIRKWNDPLIVASNKGIAFPDAEINVVHRSDGSGTTYTWSDFLSKTNVNWKSTIGTGPTLAWPVGTGAEHNEGVAAMVEKTPNSIGYVELAYAIHHQLSFGLVRNAAGEFIHANLETVALAAKDAALSSSQLPSSITNAAGKGAYPIATFTWLLVRLESVDTTKRPALTEMLRWILTNGQKECSALGYAPLPRDLAERELHLLNSTR